MKSEYSSNELLPLSGIQHFLFCRRQWALIHVERIWVDNLFTVEGKHMHQRVDAPFFSEVRGGVIITRSMPVASYRLGLNGVCDVVEFTQHPAGIQLPGRQGKYLPAPIEYKRGKEKADPCDEAQLCAQAICLEEMLAVEIPYAFLFYGKTRRRAQVELTTDLRQLVYKACLEMHQYFERGYTPRVKTSKACKSCSLVEACLPEIQANPQPASQYIHKTLNDS